ncbi:AAA family ATPase, partial [Candidatus Uhrbacteria bacterium]|nr:AAA family ATPase [Candidatus Uhrbacteria bacterium]
MNQYDLIPRKILDTVKKYISTSDVIVLHGARQVGKTSILRIIERGAQEQGSPTLYLDLEDSRFVSLLNQGVEAFLSFLAEQGMSDKKKKTFVFIDEIQYLENPSSFLKRIADHHGHIKLIVSGSSSFNIKKKFKNSLVGRTVSFEVWPLSFQEFLLFTKTPVVAPHVKNVTEPTRHMLIEKYREYCLYGGYPKIALTKDVGMKEKYLQQIIDTY